jgi:glutamate-1-semialdehyde 2,1-aminomutase
MGKGQKLYKKAKTLIPGGTQLLSKRPEMFLPDYWPSYYSKAKGCTIWDLDGKSYTDMTTMGIGACILGYADEDVNNAVKEVIDRGNMSTLNAPEEVELAEFLCELHPWAAMARYARSGGEAMAVAVRIGRAKTGKDRVLFCGYHGWHDWYLSANLAEDKALDGHLLPGLIPRGVPRALAGLALPFSYNDIEGFKALVERHRGDVGVVVLESVRNVRPQKEFLSTIMNITRDLQIVLVVDEITAGWRLTVGGAHLAFDLVPDIAVFAKCMSNGFPMGAIIGTREVMEAAQESFISSTYWTERIGPVAALTTIKKLKDKSIPTHLTNIGKEIQDGWRKLAAKNGLEIAVSGIYPLGHFEFKHTEPLVLKTLFTQLMLEKGFLASNVFYASYGHTSKDVEEYLVAVDDAFALIKSAISQGSPGKHLKGPVCHSGFKRLN